MNFNSRRKFLKSAALISGTAILGGSIGHSIFAKGIIKSKSVILSGHVWVYASKFPPDWDCTPVLEQVFSDFKYAGLEGIELMESNLRHQDAVVRLKGLIRQHELPVTGASYYGDMWDKSRHKEILKDATLVIERLQQVGASTFGITVGDAGRKKTAPELDAQGKLLKRILKVCDENGIQANLHNHTFEVENELHDWKGTLERVPELKLGPDINWLIRGGVDPVWFINTYGDQMVYLHLRDQNADGEWTRAVGEGVTDFEAIAKALKKVNFKGRAAIELAFEEPPDGPVREDWKKSREYVAKVFGW